VGDRVPPGAILRVVVVFWLAVLILGAIFGDPWAALSQLVIPLLLIVVLPFAYGRVRAYRGSPASAEAWFREEVARQPRDKDMMEYLPGLELELEYRLGLKQRPVDSPRRARPDDELGYGLWQVLPPRYAADCLPMSDAAARVARRARQAYSALPTDGSSE
jgi:hypothetical protein